MLNQQEQEKIMEVLKEDTKTFFVLDVHSFVDVITNSSSELFVLDTDKSVKLVEEILKEFCDSWNKLAYAGAFGSHHEKNNVKSLSGKQLESKTQIYTYDDMFAPVRIYTENDYKDDKRENGSYEGWGYEQKHNIGKIIIESESDNAIPYQIFEWIEGAFNTKRYHLG